MTNSIFQKLTTFTASIALSFAVVKASPTQAAIITYDFTTNLVSGYRSVLALELGVADNQEPITGFLSYDDSTLTGIGEERLGLDQNLVVFVSSSFWTIRPIRVGAPPLFVTLNNGELVGLTAYFNGSTVSPGSGNFDLFLFENRFNGQELTNAYSLQVSPLRRVSGSLSGNVQFSLRDVDTAFVPEPNIALGTCIFGLVGLVKLIKKKKLIG